MLCEVTSIACAWVSSARIAVLRPTDSAIPGSYADRSSERGPFWESNRPSAV